MIFKIKYFLLLTIQTEMTEPATTTYRVYSSYLNSTPYEGTDYERAVLQLEYAIRMSGNIGWDVQKKIGETWKSVLRPTIVSVDGYSQGYELIEVSD